MSSQFLVKLEQVDFRVQGKSILKQVDLELHPGQILTIIGPNGAGKTTLLKLILGICKPSSGKVSLAPGLKVGYMPQRLEVEDSLPITVERFLSLADKVSSTEIHQALATAGAERVLKSPLQSISGGELQRVLLARALLRKPDLLVLDEPDQGVDLQGQQALFRRIGKIRDETNCSILMVSHDLHFVMAATDQVLCINQHVCCSGSVEAVSQHPEYRALFDLHLGEDIGIYTHRHDHTHNVHGDVVHTPPQEACDSCSKS